MSGIIGDGQGISGRKGASDDERRKIPNRNGIE